MQKCRVGDLHQRYNRDRFLALFDDEKVESFENDVKAKQPHATSATIHLALVNCAEMLPRDAARYRIMACVLARL